MSRLFAGPLRIRCIVVLPGGRIVLEISGSGDDFAGYAIDQLIIGDAFDLGSADVVFSFLGDTSPVVSALGELFWTLPRADSELDTPLDARRGVVEPVQPDGLVRSIRRRSRPCRNATT